MKLKNPLMPASGTFSEGLARVFSFNHLGAMVTKTITAELRGGNPTPRVAEVGQGMLNSIGIPSKGLPYFIEHIMPEYERFSVPLVVSVSAPTVELFRSEVGQGMLNSIGIPSKGLPYFIEHIMPEYERFSVPLVVSVSAPTVELF